SRIANNLGELLSKLKNVENTKIYFKWNLIDVDPDDNKFVDCAIASQAHCIVTNDKHFNVLKSIEFPKVTIVTPDRFLELLEDEKH
ncbi:MAG: PIN domain-containing protein, partial [Bacteroidota bacterium]